MDNVKKEQENLFVLTKKELNIIMALEEIDEIEGIGIRLEDMTEDEITSSYQSLKEKNYISETEDETQWNARFIAWFDVICKAKRFIAFEKSNNSLAFYFMGESIVSIEKNCDEVVILWIPFIHLAIGQFLTFIDNAEGNEVLNVLCVDKKIDDSMRAAIVIDELIESLDLQNDITQKMVRLHAEELKEVTGYGVNANE